MELILTVDASNINNTQLIQTNLALQEAESQGVLGTTFREEVLLPAVVPWHRSGLADLAIYAVHKRQTKVQEESLNTEQQSKMKVVFEQHLNLLHYIKKRERDDRIGRIITYVGLAALIPFVSEIMRYYLLPTHSYCSAHIPPPPPLPDKSLIQTWGIIWTTFLSLGPIIPEFLSEISYKEPSTALLAAVEEARKVIPETRETTNIRNNSLDWWLPVVPLAEASPRLPACTMETMMKLALQGTTYVTK